MPNMTPCGEEGGLDRESGLCYDGPMMKPDQIPNDETEDATILNEAWETRGEITGTDW